jgi:hypothetical protein
MACWQLYSLSAECCCSTQLSWHLYRSSYGNSMKMNAIFSQRCTLTYVWTSFSWWNFLLTTSNAILLSCFDCDVTYDWTITGVATTGGDHTAIHHWLARHVWDVLWRIQIDCNQVSFIPQWILLRLCHQLAVVSQWLLCLQGKVFPDALEPKQYSSYAHVLIAEVHRTAWADQTSKWQRQGLAGRQNSSNT